MHMRSMNRNERFTMGDCPSLGKQIQVKNYPYKIRNSVQILYIFATFIIVTKLILAYSEVLPVPEFLNSIMNYAFIALMLLVILCKFNSRLKVKYLWLLVFVALAMYSSMQTKNYILLYSALGIAAIKGMDRKDLIAIIRTSFYTKIFWLSLHFILFVMLMVLAPHEVVYSVIGDEVRYRILLSQPNTCAMLFLWMLIEYTYLNFNKLSIQSFLLCTIIYTTVMCLTKSKTSIVIYVLLWIMILFKNSANLNKITRFVSKYGFILLTIVFAYLTVMYAQLPFARELNEALTGRLAGAAKVYSMSGFTILGQYLSLGTTFEWDSFYGVTSIWLENTYTMLLLNLGAIFAIIFAAMLWKAADILFSKDRIYICLMLVYGITESYIIDIFLCFPLLIAAWAILDTNIYLFPEPNVELEIKDSL